MDAVEFIKEHDRMCKALKSSCEECELSVKNNDTCEYCAEYLAEHPAEAVEIVERWAKEHPRKTRQSEFLKMFPRADKGTDGTIDLCPLTMDKEFACPEKGRFYQGECECPDCRKRYWLEEVEDVD